MDQIDVTLADGRAVTFDVERDLDGPAFFLLSIRKCGSSIFNNISNALAQANGRNYVNVGDRFFRANVTEKYWAADPGLRRILSPGNVYGGFRMLPSAFVESELFQTSPKLLFVRDLRDAVVSLYFSNAYSHPIPKADSASGDVSALMLRLREEALTHEIDEAALRLAVAMRVTAMEYEAIIDWPSVTVLRYEDYIFDKPALIDVIVERFGWDVTDEVKRDILEWADVRPTEEDPTKFIRRVTPGDHIDKLQPETIAKLNEMLGPALEMFGYETGT
jgi:sulfotransferase family protein